MADVELLPCPFCGGVEQLYVEHMEGAALYPAYRVRCDNCGASTRYTVNDCRTVWNTRANLAPLQAENERLRAEVEESDAVVDKLARLLAETAIVIKGPEPDMTKWSYHDIPDGVRAIQARADRLAEALRDARDCAESHLGLLIADNMSDGVEQTKALITKIDAALAQENGNG